MALVKAVVVCVAGALALAGCNQTATGPAQSYSSVGGPLDPSVAPAATRAVAEGGVLGNALGRDMDQSAQRKARDAELRALDNGRTGMPVAWRSGKYRGEVVPGAQYQVNAYNCRDYTHTIYGAGQPQTARATACRQPNGAWQPVT